MARLVRQAEMRRVSRWADPLETIVQGPSVQIVWIAGAWPCVPIIVAVERTSATMKRAEASVKPSGWIRGSSLRTVQFKRLLGLVAQAGLAHRAFVPDGWGG